MRAPVDLPHPLLQEVVHTLATVREQFHEVREILCIAVP